MRFPESLQHQVRQRGRGLLGTWVKLPSFETIQLLGDAGFDAVVIDMEHAPHTLSRAVELVFCAQAVGMLALIRLPDASGATIQPLLDGGADGLLVPRVSDVTIADEVTRKMVFAPAGDRGLGSTSRAGGWGLRPKTEYFERGDDLARFIQLEDWPSLERAADFASLPHVNGLFIGHGDLSLSSGRSTSDPAVIDLTANVISVAQSAGRLSAVAVASPKDVQPYLQQGVSLVILSNDTTMFGNAARRAAEVALAG